MKPKLKVLCGRTTAKGNTCMKEARDSLGCYAHSENYADERKARSSLGGLKGGVGRGNAKAREIRNVRRLLGKLIVLQAQNDLPPVVDFNLHRTFKLLDTYITLLKFEDKEPPIQSKQAFKRPEPTLDTEVVYAHLAQAVSTAHETTDDEQHDPSRGGAA